MKRFIVSYINSGDEGSFNFEAPNIDIALRKAWVKIALDTDDKKFKTIEAFAIFTEDYEMDWEREIIVGENNLG